MNLLSFEDEKFKTVKVKGYEFKIRFMSPLDLVQIAQKRMRLQNGNPVEALTQSDFAYFENISIVDVCTEELPKDFKENESCINWMDIDLINGVADEINKHTKDIESKLKKNKPIEGSAQE
jgi:hypothetical protein